MNKYYVFSVDLEEWHDLLYFAHIDECYKSDYFIYFTNIILKFLEEHKLKVTFFCLGYLAEKYPNIIREIFDSGHEIASHGYRHKLVYEQSSKEFKDDIVRSKSILEDITQKEVIGYRAPCFSITNNSLQIIKEAGFIYDSSYINFTRHDLYSKVSLDTFDSVSHCLYYNKSLNLYECELPTFLIGKYRVPISGGGYLRILPWILFKSMVNKYTNINNFFHLYTHPFELVSVPHKINFSQSLKTKFRYTYNRSKNLQKVNNLILYLHKCNFRSIRIKDYIMNHE